MLFFMAVRNPLKYYMKKIAIMSGKGGVGKSSVSILLSATLSKKYKVLLLDFDLCGPSVVKSLGIKGEISKAEKGLVPINVKNNLYVLSMGSMIKETDSVIWRGPKKLTTLNMFFDSINEEYDFVIIDTPPGISEEHGFFINKDVEAIVVTTSQNISLSDSSRAITFCKRNNINLIGIIENLSGYTCSCCGSVSNIFASNGGELLSEFYQVNFIGKLPIDPKLGELMDKGIFLEELDNSQTFETFQHIIKVYFNL